MLNKSIMTHTYHISGMTCGNCEAKVKSALLTIPDVSGVEMTRTTATVTMNKHIPLADLQQVVSSKGNYTLTGEHHDESIKQTTTWFSTYKPVLLIFVYITGTTWAIQLSNHHIDLMLWMQHFMAGFFLIFSFFKLLDLKGFAESYAMYDVVARRIPAWGYVYAFIELGLGIAYAINTNPFATNLITLIVMLVSIAGVLQSVLNKKKIRCACLGAVFNLPMSTVTIIEDSLMIVMSASMLILIW